MAEPGETEDGGKDDWRADAAAAKARTAAPRGRGRGKAEADREDPAPEKPAAGAPILTPPD